MKKYKLSDLFDWEYINTYEFEHTHLEYNPVLMVYAGPKNQFPILDCIYERRREILILRRDLANYNGG